MLAELPSPEHSESDDPRGDLDQWLDVHLWPTPGQWRPVYEIVREPGAPAWWHGEEEASQTFFKAMGIDASQLGG